MEFKNCKKYLTDLASIRLDCKIEVINKERREIANTEFFWEHGKKNKKKIKSRYSMLSNREICPSNAPLIGQIRTGKMNKKNPYLFTPTTVMDIYDNCKFNPNKSSKGLREDELVRFRQSNLMYESYDEIFFGSVKERKYLRKFFPTAIVLDILCEQFDEDLWKLVLGYIPLSIVFEQLKIDVKDVKKVYQLLIKDHYELLMAGVFRFINRFFIIKNGSVFLIDIDNFIQYYNSKFTVRNEGENRLAKIENVLMSYYVDVLKDKLKDKLKEYVDEYFDVEYHSLESIVSIQRKMIEVQKSIIDSGSLEYMNISCSPEEDNFLSILEDKNKEDEFYDDDEFLLHATRIINYIDSILTELTIYQSKLEDNVHWDGNYLGYFKKYEHGEEILDYFQNGNLLSLRKLIKEIIKSDYNFNDLNKEMYKKQHPDSYIAIEEKKYWINFLEARKKSNSKTIRPF